MGRTKTMQIAYAELLTSVMLVLSYLEHRLPLPGIVPGVKLGLANAMLLFALYALGARWAFLLMGLKVLLSGLLFGGVGPMMYSFAGGLLSMAMMLLLRRVRGVSTVGVSIGGAVFHNVGQVLLAMWVLRTGLLLSYLAVLMPIGVGTGLLTGIVASAVLKKIPSLRG